MAPWPYHHIPCQQQPVGNFAGAGLVQATSTAKAAQQHQQPTAAVLDLDVPYQQQPAGTIGMSYLILLISNAAGS